MKVLLIHETQRQRILRPGPLGFSTSGDAAFVSRTLLSNSDFDTFRSLRVTPENCANSGVVRNCSDVMGCTCACSDLLFFCIYSSATSSASSVAPIDSLYMMRRPTACFMTIVEAPPRVRGVTRPKTILSKVAELLKSKLALYLAVRPAKFNHTIYSCRIPRSTGRFSKRRLAVPELNRARHFHQALFAKRT
jgi:hypothetical protein